MKKPAPNVALKTALFATGKDQQLIAKRARISPQKLSHVIHGRRDLEPEERERLAKVLGKTQDELFGQQASEAIAS